MAYLPIHPRLFNGAKLCFLPALLFIFFARLSAQPLSAYQDGKVSTFSHDNEYRLEFQDQRGFIWGTSSMGKALYYDGYKVEAFPTASLEPGGVQSCSALFKFLEDTKGKVWAGTLFCGVERYDPYTGQFDHFNETLSAAGDIPALSCRAFFEDRQNNIWIGTQDGLYKYSYKDNNFSFALQLSHIDFIIEDQNGNIWAGGGALPKSFIQKVDPDYTKGDEEIPFPFVGDHQTANRFLSHGGNNPVVTPPGEHHQNIFLISYVGHLYRFDVANRSITPQTEGLMPGELVYSIFNDSITLVGTDKNRVLQYDHESCLFTPFLQLPELPGQTDPVVHIFRTREGLLWIVTTKRTFNVLPQVSPFQKVSYPNNLRPFSPYGRTDRLVAFKGNVYFNTTEGLKPVFEKEADPIPLEFSEQDFEVPQSERQKFPHMGHPNTRGGFKFWEDTLRHRLWMFRYQYPYGTKVFSFDEKGHRLSQYACSGQDSCFNAQFMEFIAEVQGHLWIAGWRKVGCFDPAKERFSIYYDEQNGLLDQTTYSICGARERYVWIGSAAKGISRYDIQADSFEYFLHDPSDPSSLSTNMLIVHMLESRDGKIWVATNSGLNRYEPTINGFKRFTEKDGLPEMDIFRVLEDDNGHLWIETNIHISKYIPEENTFYSFGPKDGWPGHLYLANGNKKDGKGRLFFSISDGVLYFHPDSVHLDTLIPPLYITELQLANQPVKVNDSTGILSENIAFTEQITLKYQQNVFSIHWTAPEFLYPDEINYAFQLKGFDESKRMAGSTRNATYTNLPPGGYQFLVRCQNRHGFWGEFTTLHITILPPWYRTWWAYGLWIALLAGALYAFYRFQLNRQLAEAEARRLQELDTVKTRLYTNITHEFRTPLTIIDGMASQLQGQASQSVKEGLGLIRRNGQRLFHLVNQMLDLSKLESGKLSAQIQQADVIPFLKYLLEAFHSLAEAKGISLYFSSEIDRLIMDFDPEKLQQAVGNLLSNAVKFTPEEGVVKLEVGNRKSKGGNGKPDGSNNWLRIVVSDNGRGIPEAQLDKIFDRFYQVDDSMIRSGEGTGIGLTLTKELVKLLGGKISVESEAGKGTRFTVVLPIANEADKVDTRLANTITDAMDTMMERATAASVRSADNKQDVERGIAPIVATSPKDTLLIIEDNLDVIHYLSSILNRHYKLLTATNGSAGLKAAQQQSPDIIVCDVMMPKMDGYEVCRRLKDSLPTSHIPIILLTAKADFDSRIQGLEQGADAYLAKPFEERELKVHLKKLLKGRERLRQYYTSGEFLSGGGQSVKKNNLNPKDQEFFERLLAAVEDNLSDPDFSAEQLSQLLFVSYSTCLRKVKALTGQTVKGYLRQIRIHRAARLLLEKPGRNIGAIARDVGFGSNVFFTRAFKKVMGCTPTAYREQGV